MKKVKILLIALVLILCGIFFSNVYAEQGDESYLGASIERPQNLKYQYVVPGNSGNIFYTIVKIYDVNDKVGNELAYKKNLYCLRGGVGFGAEDISEDSVKYTEIGEMHEDAETIIAYMNEYKTGNVEGEEINIDTTKQFTVTEIVGGQETVVTKDVNLYNAILWILDEAYLPVDKLNEEGEIVYDASEYKTELLDKAEVNSVDQETVTDNDIEVIQQLAIWYFTNYDEQLAGVKPTVSQSGRELAHMLYVNEDNNVIGANDARREALNTLYQYFIDGAIQNADTYDRTKIIEKNEFDKTSILEIDGSNDDYYEIGPIKFEGDSRKTVDVSDIVLYDKNGKVISKSFDQYIQEETPAGPGELIYVGKKIVYKFLDSDDKEVTSLTKGQTYKIRIYKEFEEENTYETYDMSKFTVKASSTYNLSEATFLSAGDESQPVVEIDKEKVGSSDEITTSYYDLALRKFITSINGNLLTGTSSRVPKIDLTKLNIDDTRTGKKITTATYTHAKNSLQVETGDKVIYTIRIYNEGELDGKALEITDYLPAGLELVPAAESQINITYKWVVGQGNKITTDYLKNTTIKAYDSTKTTEEAGWQKADEGNSGLYYADVQVECEVVAQISSQDQNLRNIAEISNDDGTDRDSTKRADINNYNPPADNSSYQEDDDDYEDLVLKTKEFDLSLRKYITKVNETEVATRNPDINKDNVGNGTTTAEYKHRKDPVEVETGNKVTYKITIYNEGELEGRATKVVDQLPLGLKFKRVVSGNYEVESYDEATNKLTLKETTNNSNLEAYNKETKELKSTTIEIECEVTELVGSTDKVLTNIAWISEEYNAVTNTTITNQVGEDRDSQPGTVPNKTAEELRTQDIGYTGKDNHEANELSGNVYFEGQQDDDDFEKVVIKGKKFDLALRKFITKVQRRGEELPLDSREPVIKIEDLKAGADTATYVHPKNTLSLKRGDIITYTIRVYNEGELSGYALEVKDYLPEGLELVEGQNDIWTVDADVLTTDALKEQLILGYNKNTTSVASGVKWQKASDDESGLYYYDLTVVCKIKDNVTDGAILKNVAEISSDKSEPTDIPDRDSEPGKVYEDQAHNPKTEVNGYTPGEEDDDDFERVVVEPNEVFDLALRKYIVGVKISEDTVLELPTREPNIYIDPLNQGETTADYNHRKDPVEVEIGNVVTYRFTVYNEGEIDGNVYSIIDYLPEGLTFDAESNENFIEYKEEYTAEELEGKEYAYKIEGNKITILPLDGDKLFELEAFGGSTLDSESINVKFKVTATVKNEDQVLTNVATMTYGAKGANIADRDSNKTGEEFTVPTAEKLVEGLPGYKGNEANKDDLTDSAYHYEGQQDDDDFEKIVIRGIPFDLSLRKFTTSVKRNGKEILDENRTPSIDTTTLINGTFNRNGVLEYTATYNHSKEPVVVKQGDIITYTLRIYNEGERAGYATQVTDHIPEGLALILNYKTNFDNEWELPTDYDYNKTMNLVGENGFYKTEEDIKNLKLEDFEATTSLKEVQLVTGNVKVSTNLLDEELIGSFDKTLTEETAGEGWQKAETGEGGLYYKDIQVSCLVIAEDTYKDTITNIAEISEDKDEYGNDVTDRDSIPNNVIDENEDDDDYEPIILRQFDLALRKFITGVETNGGTTEITSRVPVLSIDEETGNIKYTHPKQESPLEVANNDIVIYTLRVYNEGTLAGYAEEITDDIPEGLIFLPEHDINKQYEWKMYDKDGEVTDSLEEINDIKTTYLSEEKQSEDRDNLLKPYDSSKELSETEPLNPDYRDVKVAFRVMETNTSDRIIVNSAQISEDSNDDDDSTPGEWNDGEDEQDNEYIYVKYFDLSLLKWVTQTIVTVDGKTTTTETGFKPNTGLTETTGIRDNEEKEPVAKVEIDKNKLSKTTVKFAYKIRVTNEGEIAGYATEITDFIPKGLEFKAEDNKKYGWVKEDEDKVTTRALETVLLEPGESTELDIIFTWKNDKNNLGVKTNIAEITEDYNEYNSQDIDSAPDNKKDPYEKEQEDDDDFAQVVLSLKTGKGASYTLLVMTVVTMLAGGIYLIKKYVLTY